MKTRNMTCWSLVLAVLFVVQAAWAQGPPPPSREEMEQRERERMAEMSERLEPILSTEQLEEYDKLQAQWAQQRKGEQRDNQRRGRRG